MPNTDRNGLAISVIGVPGHDESCSGPAGPPVTFSASPA